MSVKINITNKVSIFQIIAMDPVRLSNSSTSKKRKRSRERSRDSERRDKSTKTPPNDNSKGEKALVRVRENILRRKERQPDLKTEKNYSERLSAFSRLDSIDLNSKNTEGSLLASTQRIVCVIDSKESDTKGFCQGKNISKGNIKFKEPISPWSNLKKEIDVKVEQPTSFTSENNQAFEECIRQLTSANALITDFRRKLANSEEYNHECIRKLAEAEATSKDYNDRLIQAQQINAEQERRFLEANDILRIRLGEVEGLNNENCARLKEGGAINADLNQRLAHTEARLAEVEAVNADYKRRLMDADVYERQLMHAETLNDDYNARLSNAELVIEDYRRRLKNAEAFNNDYNRRLKHAENLNDEDLTGRLMYAEVLNDDLSRRLDEADIRNDNIRTRLSSAEAFNTDYNRRLMQAEKTISDHKKNLANEEDSYVAELSTQKVQHQNQMKSKEEEILNLRESLNEALERVKGVEKRAGSKHIEDEEYNEIKDAGIIKKENIKKEDARTIKIKLKIESHP